MSANLQTIACSASCIAVVCTVVGLSAPALRTAEFPQKHFWVDVNGLFVRMTGRVLCNERLMYSKRVIGLRYEGWKWSAMKERAGRVTAFAAALRERGMPFLYVQAPNKIDLRNELPPVGWSGTNPNEKACEFARLLEAGGVHTLNLVPELATSGDDVVRNFYRTDHHWTFRSALRAARGIADELAGVLSEPALKGHSLLREDSWEWRRLDRWFLGSDGRRVGRLFAGLDDLEYCVPGFPTELRRVYENGVESHGTFEDVEMNRSRLSAPCLFDVNGFDAIGNGARVLRHLNEKAPFRERILVLTDSFGHPVCSFLSTLFREVVQVNPRKFEPPDSVRGLVFDFRPNAVVELLCATSIVNPKFKYEFLKSDGDEEVDR